ncbi:MAG: hypothetical protein JST80_00950 [Bdellovibrionales bacterium]|nr:hypothetical protein [Bdellovibrionales bacterium]
MSNMELKKALRFAICVLFSTTLVEYSAQAQNDDKMYRQMRKHPSMSKDDYDRIRRETVDNDRINKLNDFSDEQKRQQASEEKMIPPDSAADIADKDEGKDEKPEDRPLTPRLPSAPPPENSAGGSSSSSSDSPKVSYDAMPDEIKFPGDPEASTPKAKPKGTPRPSYKKRY